MNPAYHSIIVSLVTGLFFFAVIALALCAVLRLRGEADRPVVTYADRAALGAASIAVALTVVGIVSGFLIWPLEAALRSPLIKSKILAAFLIVAFWGMYLYVRISRGPDLWRSAVMGVYVTLLGLTGFGFNLITNSIGGDAAGNPSGFENLVRLFGVETRFTFYLPTWLNLAIIVGGVLALVVAYVGRQPGAAIPTADERSAADR